MLIEENVEPSVAVCGLGDDFLGSLRIGYIAGDEEGLAAPAPEALIKDALSPFLAPSSEREDGSLFGNSRAVASPIPDVAPVIRHTLPCSLTFTPR